MATSVASTGSFPRGRTATTFTGSVERWDTTARDLFFLRAGDIPLNITVYGTAVSNAGTNARLSIGSTSNATYFVSNMDLKGTALTSGGSGIAIPSSATNLGVPLSFDTIVQGTYFEAGTASTSGGPWVVVMQVLTV